MAKTNKRKELEYAVKYLHDTMKLDIKAIALELGVAEAVVDGILSQQPTEPKAKKVSKSQNLMIRHSSAKKNNNVSIMTEGASQLNDEFKKSINNTQSRIAKKSIFKPNG